MATIVSPPSASATFPGRPGKIAFEGVSGFGIRLINPDGSGSRQWAETDVYGGPAFFANGRRNAYIGGRAGPGVFTQYTIFIKRVSDRNPHRRGRRVLGWHRFWIRHISVTPSGERIVFSGQPKRLGFLRRRSIEIYSVKVDGSDLRRLTRNRAFDNDPDVSPNGRRVAFVRRVGGRAQVFTMKIDGSHEVRVTHDSRRDRAPSWGPFGNRIVFFSQRAGPDGSGLSREIYTVDADGESRRRITHNRVPDDQPVFSPNGRQIAFVTACRCPAFSDQLYVMRANGSRRHLLADGDFGGSTDPAWGPIP